MIYTDFDSKWFIKQRKRLFKLIDKELQIDSHHKSYEGTLSINFNNRFEYDDDTPEIYIHLSCYVAPFNGRSDSFSTQKDFEQFLDDWEEELNESISDEV